MRKLLLVWLVLCVLIIYHANLGPVNNSTNQLASASEQADQSSAFLDEVAKDTWAYISSDQASTNHLPLSWYASPASKGEYANTAEIGLYALSWVAAHDLGETWSPDWTETEEEVTATLNQLRAWQTGSQAYQPNGANAYDNKVFYQWYWISSNPPVVSGSNPDHLVPSIDNAWLAVSLITIREYAEAHDYDDLAAKADAILSDMDFLLWYNSDTSLFSWGDVENPQGSFIADNYSNENRIINFTARAMGQLSRDEFIASLDALSQPSKTYDAHTVEKTAYDGSYFTYISPALFIREPETDYGTNTIDPATAAQITYAADEGYDVWGLSDCFDVGIGNYVQQGAPPTVAAGSPETRPGLVSAHASSMALLSAYSTEAEVNLQAIADNFVCAYDDTYGFRDSVNADPDSANYEQCSNRFSILAQEWLFLSLVNHENGFIWKYFYRDSGVKQAHAEMFSEYGNFLPMIVAE